MDKKTNHHEDGQKKPKKNQEVAILISLQTSEEAISEMGGHKERGSSCTITGNPHFCIQPHVIPNMPLCTV